MTTKPINKQFYRFVLPSMFTMLLNGLYTIVDGFFVGNAVGDVGLAAIGLVWPITAVLIAVGMGIGVGGSVIMSTYRGAGDPEKANRARGNTILLLAAVSIVVTVLLMIFNPILVQALGAKGEVFDSAMSYIRIISLGGSMQLLSSGLIPIIRNSHKTVQAMAIMGGGLIANIILDALFTMVIPWGLAGAALATILGQMLTTVLSLLYLACQRENKVRRSDFIPDGKLMKKAVLIGISPFGLSLMPSLITVFNNWQCLNYGGELAVSAYAVVNYLLASVLFLLEGIGEGMQPMISYCYGAGDYDTMRKIRNKGLRLALLFSAAFLLLTIPARFVLPRFFATSGETGELIRSALPILGAAFPMMGIGKLFTSYFYASGRGKYAMALVYSDPLLFTPLCISLLPMLWGLNGVWAALPGAQALVMLLLVFLLIRNRKKFTKRGVLSYAG